ncbi:hypothetical protein G9H71_19555, partial [Motilibacter sp. E257]|nr:hypothetical protein [Motilibacter deserti]
MRSHGRSPQKARLGARALRAGLPVLGVVLAGSVLPLPGTTAQAASKAEAVWDNVGDEPATTYKGKKAEIAADDLNAVKLDRGDLAEILEAAPDEAPSITGSVLALPKPGGGFARFSVSEYAMLEAKLAAKHPEIRTYTGVGIDDPSATVHADLSPLGFHASVRSSSGAWFVDPYYKGDQSLYVSYFGRDLENPDAPFAEKEVSATAASVLAEGDVRAAAGPDIGTVLRTYRLALVTDPTYASYFGSANVLAAKVTLMNRVNQIYEDDLAVRMVLVDGTDKLNLDTTAKALGANGPCGAAPCYTSSTNAGGVTTTQLDTCGSGTLSRTRIVLGQLIGASNYDIGHIGLGRNGGGVASLGVVGGGSKAQGCTGLPTPVGDYYAVDYVAHEIGHQFSGNHTFNGAQSNCSGGNRNSTTSVEPGSGSSIMAYAGICWQDDLQPHSDPYFSAYSQQEMTAYITSSRPAINEVQTVSLRDFDLDGKDAFQLLVDGSPTAPIYFGHNYTAAGIKAALESSPTWPAGAVATVAPFGNTGALNAFGFQVTFSGSLAGQNVNQLGIASFRGSSGFVGETAKGGPVDNNGWQITPTGNTPPMVSTPESFTIPYRTPFSLTGGATDADGQQPYYSWEQIDLGRGIDPATGAATTVGTALVNNRKINGPLFRVFGTRANVTPANTVLYNSPGENTLTTNPTRVFPDMAQILVNNTNAKTGACPAAPPLPPNNQRPPAVDPVIVECFSEFLPTADYVGPMHFRLTARDFAPNGGGVGSQDTTVNLAPGTGPFLVTSQATSAAVNYENALPVTWDVAGTAGAPINATDVKISLSADGGATFAYVLAESTPNDG